MKREELERALAERVAKVEMAWFRKLSRLIGDPPDVSLIPPEFWEQFAAELASVLRTAIGDAGLEWLKKFMDGSPIGLEWTEMVDAADEWAEAYAQEWSGRIVQNTRKLVERVGMQDVGREEFLRRVGRRFSPIHAELVGITEVTRAQNWAANELQRQLESQGLRTQQRWLTAEDERVCPICKPLDHKIRESGAWAELGQPDGPPAHPRCRCQVVVEYKRRGAVT